MQRQICTGDSKISLKTKREIDKNMIVSNIKILQYLLSDLKIKEDYYTKKAGGPGNVSMKKRP